MIKNIFITFSLMLSFNAYSQSKANVKILKKLNDTTCVIELENNYKALYNLNSKVILLDSIVDFYILNNACIIAKIDRRVNVFEESMGEVEYEFISEFFLFNFLGKKMLNERLDLPKMIRYDAQGMDIIYYQMPICSKDSQCIILNTFRYGVISNTGKIILPFYYSKIDFSEKEDYFIAVNPFMEETLNFSRSGERFFGYVTEEIIKKDNHKQNFKGKVKSYTETTFSAKKSIFKFKKSAILKNVNYRYINRQLLGVECVYDSSGNLNSTIKFHFDENEKLLQKDYFNSIGQYIYYEDYTYPENELRIRIFNIFDSLYYRYSYKFDELGNEIESFIPINALKEKSTIYFHHHSFEELFEGTPTITSYKFDEKGNKLIEEHFDQITNYGYKELFSKKTYAYDINNNKIEENEYDGKSLLKSKTNYSYNEKGDIIGEVKYNDNGIVISKQSYKIKYDSIGNWIEKVNYLNNKPISILVRVISY